MVADIWRNPFCQIRVYLTRTFSAKMTFGLAHALGKACTHTWPEPRGTQSQFQMNCLGLYSIVTPGQHLHEAMDKSFLHWERFCYISFSIIYTTECNSQCNEIVQIKTSKWQLTQWHSFMADCTIDMSVKLSGEISFVKWVKQNKNVW